MKDEPMTRDMARRFLLGAVDDSERQQIETLFMTDPETEEAILSAEDELLEDYLEGNLSESDSARFCQQYAAGTRQQRKLRITASIREFALSGAQRSKAGASAIENAVGFTSVSWFRERRFIPIAATLIVLVIAAIWLIQWNNQRMREVSSRLALERELTDLNSPAGLTQEHPQMLTVVLPPVSLRGVNRRSEVMSRSEYPVLELHLLSTQKSESQRYTAVVRRVGETDAFTLENLHAEKSSDGNVIRLRLPAKSLPPGHYEISLSGGPSGTSEQYDFVLGD